MESDGESFWSLVYSWRLLCSLSSPAGGVSTDSYDCIYMSEKKEKTEK